MITILYPYRNRDILRVKRSLDSLDEQRLQNFEVNFIDYGSHDEIASQMQELVLNYSFTKYEYLYTKQQPWNKSKALNYAIKKIESDYCFVADVDMIFHPEFISVLESKKDPNTAIYFKVGFLYQGENQHNKVFDSYQVKFYSDEEATGITLFPVDKLRAIHGFDEFFHFWGAEDTDIHNRLKNFGCKVDFYDEKVLLLHQWHPNYRMRETSYLNKELQVNRIVEMNHHHLKYNLDKRTTIVNLKDWGIVIDELEYRQLTDFKLVEISNEVWVIDHLLFVELPQLVKNEKHFISVRIKDNPIRYSFKYKMKKLLRRKVTGFYSLKEINDKLLLHIVSYYHQLPYVYKISDDFSCIDFKIVSKKNALNVK